MSLCRYTKKFTYGIRRDYILKYLPLSICLLCLTYYVSLNHDSYTRYGMRVRLSREVVLRDGLLNKDHVLPSCTNESMRLTGFLPLPNEDILNTSWTSQDDVYELRRGGWWKPLNCTSRQDIAIIIPFRDRLEHLMTLLETLHLMLQRQMATYRIFLVEQNGTDTFNKARLMNIGYAYVRFHYRNINCIIFHDVDMIPEDDRNIYFCGKQPRHLSPAVNEMNYTLPYKELVGGVLAILPEHFEKINGYSNLYWGWGGEDDDFYYRMEAENLTVERPSDDIGRYSMIVHQKRPAVPGKIRYKLVWSAKRRYKIDGLAQIDTFNYTILSVNERMAYTHLLIDVGDKPNYA